MSVTDAFFGRKTKKPANAGSNPDNTAPLPRRQTQSNPTGGNAQNGGAQMSGPTSAAPAAPSQSAPTPTPAGPAPTSPQAQANMDAAAAAARASSGSPIGTTQVPTSGASAAPAPGLAPTGQPVYVQPVYLAGQSTATPAMDASAAMSVLAAALAGNTVHHYVRQDGGEFIFTREGQLRAAQALDNPAVRGRLIDALTGAPVSPADLALIDQLVAYSPELGQQLGVTSRGTFPYWFDPVEGKRYLEAGKVPASARFRVVSRTGRFRKEGDHWEWERDL